MSSKRGNNEGTINQRKDGRWESRITVGYRDGKQIRKCLYGKTRQDVAAKLSSALTDVQRGQILPDHKISLKSFLDTWLSGTAKTRLRVSTYSRYEILINKHIVPHIGRVAVGKLSPQQVQRLWTQLQQDGLSARTVIQIRAILRTALNQAVRHGLTPRNVAALSDPPKPAPFKPVFLDPEQADKLLKEVKGHHLEALITLALTAGMRIGEILGLTWGDLDLKGRQLHVRQQQQRVGKELITCDPKTERSARTLPLTQLAVDALDAHRKRQIKSVRAGFESGHLMTGRVFINEKGSPVENGTVLRQFQRLVKEAGMPKMRLHDLRHSCATLLLSRGVHPRVVMEILGHSTIAMTMNVYSHVIPQIARDAADQMDAIFDSPTSTPDSERSAPGSATPFLEGGLESG
jgi:integrase